MDYRQQQPMDTFVQAAVGSDDDGEDDDGEQFSWVGSNHPLAKMSPQEIDNMVPTLSWILNISFKIFMISSQEASKDPTVQVGWGIIANHGGGYSYRLCKDGQELTEECFQVSLLAL